ncbi:anti-sigma factor [Sphingomonas adhaesiva]|uniref:anti-sigma factor n=1 Tax=Sphingomonas adhaesiva TaxID=28212 RepID=UPI002FF53FF4
MTSDPPTPSTQAAELALGLLDGDERAAALRRVLSDADFAQEVAWWREQFSGLLDDYPPVAPTTDLLPRVDEAAGAAVMPQAPRRWGWFTGGLVSGAVAASLAAAVMIPRPAPIVVPAPAPAPAPAAPLIAVLVPSNAGAQAPVAAWLARNDGALRLTAAVPVPRGRSAELWAIGPDKVPHPLGLLSATGRSSQLTDPMAGLKEGDTLAISIEPQGGSPTGAPTGPVIASGVVVMT